MTVARYHLDFETRSAVDLRKTGLYRYAEDPSTGVWGFCWSAGDGLVYRWVPGDPEPTQLLDHVANGGLVVAHNAAFERTIWRMMRERRITPHWPELRIEQQSCTMARAQAISLPADLDGLARVLGQQAQKDKVGSALMRKMAKPRKILPNGDIIWWAEPENVERLMQYCEQDVRTEEETDRLIPELSAHERKVWEFDQRVNDRGIHVDVNACVRAVDMVDFAKTRADAEMRQITGGKVLKCSNHAALARWVDSRGISCQSVAKEHQDDILLIADASGDDLVRRALEVRKEAGKTSTAKYKAITEAVCDDGRVRGSFAYHGAGPGRWAGRLVQPHNLPRVNTPHDQFCADNVWRTLALPLPVTDLHDMIEMGIGPVTPSLSMALRSMICAEPGNVLYGADYSNIEGRVNAWMAGEQWKLDAFREYDEGKGHDLYKLAFSNSFGKPVEEVDKQDRQIGKVQELACGYQGGVGAYISMGDNYNIDPADIAKTVVASATAEKWDAMAIRYEKSTDKFNLPEDQWTAIKLVVGGWRAAHPNIVQFWWDLGDAAIEAVDTPGVVVPVRGGMVNYVCTDGWLYCQLPSSRVICYCQPFIRSSVQVLVNKDGEEYERVKRTVWFFGRDATTGRWVEKYLYGGLQCENVVQGTARCILDRAMLALEERGYSVMLHVHDEAVAEVEKSFGSLGEFQQIMAKVPDFAHGLPLAVGPWTDERYVK